MRAPPRECRLRLPYTRLIASARAWCAAELMPQGTTGATRCRHSVQRLLSATRKGCPCHLRLEHKAATVPAAYWKRQEFGSRDGARLNGSSGTKF